MKRPLSFLTTLATTALLAAPLLTQAAAPQASTLSDYGFSYKGKHGSVMPICYGDRMGTGYTDILPNISICDGITEIRVGYDGQLQNSYLIKTLLPTDSEYTHREDAGVIWNTPEVVSGTLKNTLLIRSDLVDNYTGLTGYLVYPTYAFDFKTKKIEPIGNTPEKVLWNKAGTKGLFIPTTCGGAGCFDSAPIKGINLLTGDVTDATTMKASNEGYPTQGPNMDVNGHKLTTWQSMRWVNNSVFEATYMSVDGKIHTVRKSF